MLGFQSALYQIATKLSYCTLRLVHPKLWSDLWWSFFSWHIPFKNCRVVKVLRSKKTKVHHTGLNDYIVKEERKIIMDNRENQDFCFV